MTWLVENLVNIFAVLGAVYALARAIVYLTPTPKDDEVVEKVGGVLRALAALFGLDLRQGVEKKKPASRSLLPLLLVGVLAFGLSACASPERAYVDADASTYELLVEPSLKYPEGRIPTWVARDKAEGRISDLEAELMGAKLSAWKLRIEQASEADQ